MHTKCFYNPPNIDWKEVPMEYPNQKQKLSNGAIIIAEISIEPEVKLIVAYYEHSNHPYVCWHMNTWDRAAYWGHYFDTMAKAFDYFTKKYTTKIPIELDLITSIETNCARWIGDHKCFEVCSLFDNPQLYTVSGTEEVKGVIQLTDHYTACDANNYGLWLANQLKVQQFNKMHGKGMCFQTPDNTLNKTS